MQLKFTRYEMLIYFHNIGKKPKNQYFNRYVPYILDVL